MITCRIIVKKNSKHTGGGGAEILSQIYKKSEFSEEDKEKIKAEMFIENAVIEGPKTNYEPINLTATIQKLIVEGEAGGLASTEFLKLGENDPILQFFPISEFEIGFDLRGGKMTLKYNNKFKRKCYISYEFTGDEDSFYLHIYNLESCNELEYSEFMALHERWENYIQFLHKLYPDANIYIYYYPERPFSNSNRNRLTKLKYENFIRFFKNDPEPLNSNNNSNLNLDV